MSSLIGQSIGRYHILEQLGEGGMAIVYKAYDTRLERNVAIKVIRTDPFVQTMLDQVLKRFEREAKALAQLSHPNIVSVYDYGEYEGAPYLVMAYIPSGTLKQKAGIPIPWQKALRILLPIAQALAYAHEHNIIHRDIKPANILLTGTGLPMLSDFGIAKILESEGSATLTGVGKGVGTPGYMAPEQWTGHASPQSDIYSLGVVLYELVTGRKPYTADTPVAIMLKQVNDPLPQPRLFAPDLPEELEMVLFKALAKKLEDRYQSMSDFAAALESLAGGQTIPAGGQLVGAPAEATLFAGPVRRPEAQQAPQMVEGGWNPAAEAVRSIPMPPAQPRQRSIKWGLWIPIAGLAVLLCIGLIVGGGFMVMGLKGKAPLAGLPAAAATSTQSFTPTQQVASTLIASPTLKTIPTQLPAPTLNITFTPPPSEFKVLWDISHGPRASGDGSLYTPDGMYKSLAQDLGRAKFVVASGNLTDLNSVSILVLSETSADKMNYTNNEADQIEQFVRVSGHGLLIMSDIPGFLNRLDIVSRRFSIGLGGITSDGPVSFSNEPFFSGVSSLQFLFGGGVLQVSPPGLVAASDKDGNPVIAFCECDAGRVMVISDSNLWDNRGLSQADNQRFASDVFQWLAKVSP